MPSQFPLLTGKQTRLLLIDPDGSRVGLDKVMEWDWKRDNKEIESIGLDGVRDIAVVYNGVSGSFQSEIESSSIYDFFDDRAAEYTGSGQSRYATIFVYMTMPDGSEIAYRMSGVTLMLEDGGKAKHDETVKIKATFKAQDCSRA